MNKIIVGLSGGVDSAVTVYLLKKQGYQVIGIFLDMLNDVNHSEIERAKLLAKQLDIELIQKDIQEIFQKEIVSEFVNKYRNGLTPNPCISCNPKIKFKYLLEIADELNIKKVATGHYALIAQNKQANRILQKAEDKTKDQSYFLYRLTQKELKRIEFPLGKLKKTEVKKIAEEVGLKIPKAESQDVCFLKNFKSLAEFLQSKLQQDSFKQGKIVDNKGQILGNHRGLPIYTLGQRKGLDIGGDGPFYVVGKDFERNQLLVSRNKKNEKLMQREIIIDNVNWLNGEPEEDKKYQIKVRYQMKSVEAKLEQIEDKKWKVKCADPVWAIAPGQSLVIYDDDKVVGGGIISDNK